MADRIWLMPKQRPLRADMPETLVLDGAFQAAFALDDVTFDEQTGAFRIRHARHWPVTVAGDGPAVMWTPRALERHGFYAASRDDRPTASLEVSRSAEGIRWHLEIEGRSSQRATLAAGHHPSRKSGPCSGALT